MWGQSKWTTTEKVFFLGLVAIATLCEAAELRLGLGRSELIESRNLSRVAVSDGRKLRARAFPPHEVLVTGLKEGVVTLRLWAQDGTRTVYDVYIEKGLAGAQIQSALAEALSRSPLGFDVRSPFYYAVFT